MMHNRMLPLVLILIVCVTPIRAHCADNKLPPQLALFIQNIEGGCWLSQTTQEKLASAHKRWLEEQKKILSRPGKQGPASYNVVSYLGEGYEGKVYLVRMEDGSLRSLKIIRRHYDESLESHHKDIYIQVNSMAKMEASGVPMVRVLNYDISKSSLEFEYVEGFSVVDIQKKYLDFGMSGAEIYEFNRRFAEFKSWAKKRYDSNYAPRNVVFEFKTGRFVVIDPF